MSKIEDKKYSKPELQEIINGIISIKLDLGCGARKKKDHIGVDIAKLDGVDIVCDINNGLPFEDNTIDGIYSNFMFEHIPDTIGLFKELYRICNNGAVIEFKVPYYQSLTQFKDPTHKAFILPETMPYFTTDKWYGSDYGINVNTKVLEINYEYLSPFDRWQSKKYFIFRPILNPLLKFARHFLWNVVHSITIKLEVIK